MQRRRPWWVEVVGGRGEEGGLDVVVNSGEGVLSLWRTMVRAERKEK